MLYIILHVKETSHWTLIHNKAHAVDVVEWLVRVDHAKSSNHILTLTEIKSFGMLSWKITGPISEDYI